jgi:ABC-2 type transport system permease protein
MLLTLLLASGLLAIERTENAYSRLIRGLVTPGELLSEKVLLSAACAGVVSVLMAAFVSLFVHLEWSRFELWVVALAVAGLAFGALGVLIGAVAREVSSASLLALLLSLPVAFVALVPGTAVSSGVKTLLDVIAFAFPFKPALQAVSNAFSGTAPGIAGPLVHLAVLAVVYFGLARVAVRRFT